MIRAVLDANVLVSALLSPQAAPAKILRAWRDERFQLLISTPILEEVGRVLRYPRLSSRHGLSEEKLSRLLGDLERLAVLTSGKLRLREIGADPSDDRYLECAVEGAADYLVSGDVHLLGLASYGPVRIVKPAAFLRMLDQAPPV